MLHECLLNEGEGDKLLQTFLTVAYLLAPEKIEQAEIPHVGSLLLQTSNIKRQLGGPHIHLIVDIIDLTAQHYPKNLKVSECVGV